MTKKMESDIIRNLFVKLFKASDLTQRELSKRSGVSEDTVGRFIAGGGVNTRIASRLLMVLKMKSLRP